MIKKKLFLFFFLLQLIFSYSQINSKLNTEIEKLKTDSELKNAVWSICVMPANKDTVLTEYNSQISLVPASTLKIATTGAALITLGGDFKFETKLQYTGVFDTLTGTIKGNLYIVGGGDPTLESENFINKNDSLSTTDKWAKLLREKGIKKIEGAIIGDAGIFDDNMVPSQWIWADIGNYFGAGASGLSYHDNKYTLYLKSGPPGSSAIITEIKPAIDSLQMNNKVTSRGDDDNAFIYGVPYSYFREIQGTIPAFKNNYEVEGSIPDPALFCAQSFAQSFKKFGIAITGQPTTVRILKETNQYSITNKYDLYTHYSPPLSEIIYWTNYKSINLYAEHLLKYLAYKKAGIGSENEGTEIIPAFWKNSGVDISGFIMNDGCGLSRANIITTKTETQILRVMANDKNFNAFYNSFPVAGKIGSLDNMFEGSWAKGNLCAKSGYITRTRGYAGYVKNKKGELICFSVIANNYVCSASEMKKKLEKLMIAIAEME